MAIKDSKSGFEAKPFGRYVLIDKLAIGGMAEIYKAKTYGVDGFEKLLAIKRILSHYSADKDFISMLVDEAKLTVLLSHANIVQVFDLGKVSDDYFISMEYIHGTNLRDVIAQHGRLDQKFPEEIAVYIVSEMCKGLDYAHRKTDSQGKPLHIVHRDISPQNILISYEGEVKIVDFGIAKAAMNVSHTMAGILKGKVSYMSPEQALGKPVDHRTDIFSAGVILYEMLTGEKLFSGETQFEVLNQIRTTRVNTLMLPDTISGPLKAIIAKALTYNVKDRYQSAGDFQLDLTKYLYSSYVDFSPRQLSAILGTLFENEIKRKENLPPIDENTKAAVNTKPEHENIVVHGPADKTLAVAPKEVTLPTGVSLRVMKPKGGSKRVLILSGLLLLTVIASVFSYKMFLSKKASHSTEIVSPSEDYGSLQITTIPPGARILINGEDTGLVTPTKITKLNIGDEYQIKLVKENYSEWSRSIAITSDQPVTFNETLVPLAKGVIEVDSSPQGAHLFVNDQDTKLTTPTKIENLEIAKNYRLKLSLPNYQDWSNELDLKDFNPVKVSASLVSTTLVATTAPPQTPIPAPVNSTPTTLAPVKVQKPAGVPTPEKTKVLAPKKLPPPEPVKKQEPARPVPLAPQAKTEETIRTTTVSGKPGMLQINSDPHGAQVFLNSELKGTTPLKISELSPGTLKLTLSKEGFLKKSMAVTLEPGESKSMGTIHLGKLYGEIAVDSYPPRADVYLDGQSM
ncbi:MAG: PEGA domain-containing protein, partial [Deltaproteobacteria bacterium]|nr:PEGA domain-containing protein [Deltaproteobacteria bacterium]